MAVAVKGQQGYRPRRTICRPHCRVAKQNLCAAPKFSLTKLDLPVERFQLTESVGTRSRSPALSEAIVDLVANRPAPA